MFVLFSPSTGITGVRHHACLMWCWGWNPGLCAHYINALSTEPHLDQHPHLDVYISHVQIMALRAPSLNQALSSLGNLMGKWVHLSAPSRTCLLWTSTGGVRTWVLSAYVIFLVLVPGYWDGDPMKSSWNLFVTTDTAGVSCWQEAIAAVYAVSSW